MEKLRRKTMLRKQKEALLKLQTKDQIAENDEKLQTQLEMLA
jgi:hypothetical protein